MTRRSATFQEVAISHCSSSHLIQDPCYSVPKGINLITKESKSRSASSFSRSRSFLSCVWNLPRMSLKLHPDNRSVASSAVTINDYDSDIGDTLSVPTDKEKESTSSKGALKTLRKVIKSASFLAKSPKSERRSSLPSSVEPFPTNTSKVQKIESRVDGWTNALKSAIQLDLRDDTKGALLAYGRFNRQVTKEAIYDFELLTCDQQKLLSRLMQALDQRIMILRAAMWKPASLSSAPGSPTQSETSSAHDTSLHDLQNCLSLLDTVKEISSSRKVPVVLVYRERRHRTRHRHQDKGKSNKIIFAKEKREFLQFLGLPGSMVTEQGIDFNVQPSPNPEDAPPALLHIMNEGDKTNSQKNLESLEADSNQENSEKTNGDVLETPFEETAASTSEVDSRSTTTSPQLRSPSRKGEKRISIVNQFLGIRKRFSVSPHRGDQDSISNQYHSCEGLSSEALSSKDGGDTRSTLSCDSCSSNESSVSDSVDREDRSDTAVLANYSHQTNLLSPPLQTSEETYIVLVFEKVGLKKTEILDSPFLRLSIRDYAGSQLTKEQETATWPILNENYLKAPSSIFLHQTLEQMVEDSAIFLEVRHLLQEKRKISTLCYTFLEKSDLRHGEFICELYKPPLQFSRKNLVPYSEKALFLHLEIRLETSESETSSFASTNQN